MQPKNMEAKPENFEDEWVFAILPPGRRRILVAANNITQSYNNSQIPDIKFHSCLPSGNITRDEMFKQEHLTLLDAIYSPEKKHFYIVDMIHWRHYPYYDTEAEFRFFCLQSKWDELQIPIETRSTNEFPLELLNKYPCSEAAIEEALKACKYKIEYLLFIKKSSVYVIKESYDCLRLRLEKLTEVLGIPIPEGLAYPPAKSKDAKESTEKGTDKAKNAEDNDSTRENESEDEEREQGVEDEEGREEGE